MVVHLTTSAASESFNRPLLTKKQKRKTDSSDGMRTATAVKTTTIIMIIIVRVPGKDGNFIMDINKLLGGR